MEPTVFGLEESAAQRAAALDRYIGPGVAPISAGSASGVSAQPDRAAAPGASGLALADSAESTTAQEGWSDTLDLARDVQRAFGAFTHVPESCDGVLAGTGGIGDLAGVPVAIKDNIAVRGMPLSASSAVMAGEVAARDAVVVERLRSAGVGIIGKAALDEFAFGTVGPGIANPTCPGLTVGGSSGGSAVAVAAGACPIAVGTDTGGSVRIPASCTGVVGFKPTGGWVPNDGVIPLSWSLDTVGLLAADVDGVAAAYHAIAGDRPRAPQAVRPLGQLRVARPDDRYLRVAVGTVTDGFLEASKIIGSASAGLELVDLPDSDDSLHVQYLVVLAESASYHRGRWGADATGYTDAVQSALERGDAVSARSYLTAQRARNAMRARLEQVMSQHDVLILPTMAIDPPAVDVDEVTIGDGRVEDPISAMLRFTALFNHVGFPAISLPLATEDGVPRGLQLVGRPGGDAELLGIARSFSETLAG